jgi:hypothetical protein
MRVALAALLWRRGQEAAAEEQWQFACDNITWAGGGAARAARAPRGSFSCSACKPRAGTAPAGKRCLRAASLSVRVPLPPPLPPRSVGCRKYQDRDWLSRIRRWPPSMCAALADFLALQRGAGAGAA